MNQFSQLADKYILARRQNTSVLCISHLDLMLGGVFSASAGEASNVRRSFLTSQCINCTIDYKRGIVGRLASLLYRWLTFKYPTSHDAPTALIHTEQDQRPVQSLVPTDFLLTTIL